MDHNQLIKAKAKEILAPRGFRQKGSSRLWYRREGWWSCLVEFQPSGFSKGSLLNVGACLHWFPREHFTFDLGYRERPHAPAQADFAVAVDQHCHHALNVHERIAGAIADDFAYAELAKAQDGHWRRYNRLCAAILGGGADVVARSWEELAACSAQVAWQQEVIDQGRRLFESADRTVAVQELIAQALAKLELS